MNERASSTRIIILILAVLGFCTLVTLSAWGVTKMTKGVRPFQALASLISSITLQKEVIETPFVVSTSQSSVETGKAVELNWQYDKYEAGGVYVLRIACVEGVELALATKEKIGCDAAFNLWARNSITIIPTLKGKAPKNVSLEIGFIPQGHTESVARANTTLTVISLGASGTVNVTSPTTNNHTPGTATTGTYPVGVPAVTSGPTDLTIEIIDTGIINESTNVFAHATTVMANMRAGIVFDIINKGGATSQPWIFQAQLPIASGTFRSDTQEPLKSGARVRFTIGFKDLMNSGNNSVIIKVDPDNQISDGDRANNSAGTTIHRGY